MPDNRPLQRPLHELAVFRMDPFQELGKGLSAESRSKEHRGAGGADKIVVRQVPFPGSHARRAERKAQPLLAEAQALFRLGALPQVLADLVLRSEETTSELQSLMRHSYGVLC